MPAKILNSTKALCEVPPNTVNLDFTYVELTLNSQNYTDDDVPYYFYRPPKIYDIKPHMGPTKGNTTVMVWGADFKTDKKPICKFGDIKTKGEIISSSQVKCISPKVDSARVAPLSIMYEGDINNFESESKDYLYYETPEVFEIQPACGPTYGYT